MSSAAYTFVSTFVVLILGAYVGALADRFSYWFHVSRSLLWKKHCPECFTPQAWVTAVPVCGYVVQRGVCSSCRATLPLSAFFSELIGALSLYGLFIAVFGRAIPDGWMQWVHAAALLVTLGGVMVLFIADLVYDEVPVGVYVATIAALAVTLWLAGGMDGLVLGGQGMLIAGIIMLILAAISKFTWVHAHDILLGMLVGCIVGWPAIAVTLAFTYIFAVIGALATWGLKFSIYKGTSSFGLYLFLALALQTVLALVAG